jgi:hypothetical protein
LTCGSHEITTFCLPHRRQEKESHVLNTPQPIFGFNAVHVHYNAPFLLGKMDLVRCIRVPIHTTAHRGYASRSLLRKWYRRYIAGEGKSKLMLNRLLHCGQAFSSLQFTYHGTQLCHHCVIGLAFAMPTAVLTDMGLEQCLAVGEPDARPASRARTPGAEYRCADTQVYMLTSGDASLMVTQSGASCYSGISTATLAHSAHVPCAGGPCLAPHHAW